MSSTSPVKPGKVYNFKGKIFKVESNRFDMFGNLIVKISGERQEHLFLVDVEDGENVSIETFCKQTFEVK